VLALASPRQRRRTVPTYVIEREIPGAGALTPEELGKLTVRSNCVLRELGPRIEWIETYVTDDRFYCIYQAPNADLILQHARKGGFPANRVSEVRAVIGPNAPPARCVQRAEDGMGSN
jgi:hypothetical protein